MEFDDMFMKWHFWDVFMSFEKLSLHDVLERICDDKMLFEWESMKHEHVYMSNECGAKVVFIQL
jgi:hypothetical protein